MRLNKTEFLEQIYTNQGLIHKVCKMYRDTKEDREDLFQEIIYQLWKAYPRFQGRSKITTWIYRISLNTAIASFRKPKKVIPVWTSQEPLSDTSTEESENWEKLQSAIQLLNQADRALITLYFESLSYAEIGQVLGITEVNVGVRLNRIKTKIKNQLNL